jgi:hypothetical protein
MSLAAADGEKDIFDQYRLHLAKAPMPVRLLATYYLEVGDGFSTFDQPDEARGAYMHLARLAEKHGLTEQSRVAFEALRDAPRDLYPTAQPDGSWPDIGELVKEVDRLHAAALRRLAGTRPGLATKLGRGRRRIR